LIVQIELIVDVPRYTRKITAVAYLNIDRIQQ